jgi:agmatine deiminase
MKVQRGGEVVKEEDLTARLPKLMPAEWQPHEASWIAWPHHRQDWPGKFDAIPWVYAEIVRHLHRAEKVCILVNDGTSENRAKKVLSQVDLNWDRICFFHIPTDRVWTRDYGPILVRTPLPALPPRVGEGTGGGLVAIHWRFNGWAKYNNWKRDDAAGQRICRELSLETGQPKVGNREVVLEGGSIDVNGAGCLLTTEECLLSKVQARNPGLQRSDYEALFAE